MFSDNNDELEYVAANYEGADIEYDAYSVPILEAEIKKDVLYRLKIAIAEFQILNLILRYFLDQQL